VRFNSEDAADVVRIAGDYPPVIILRAVENANIVSIDIPFSSLNLPAKWLPSLNFIKSIDTKQIDEHTVRITMETFADASMDISYEGNTALVKLTPATYHNISYAGKTIKLKKDPLYPVNINAITHRDEYNSYRYIITLDGNFQGWLGWGRYYVNDDYINNIEISVNTYGERQLIINEKQVLAFDIYQDAEYIYIKAMAPREKYNRIVIIDPGHGGSDPGAADNGVTEKFLNLDTANRVMALFEQSGHIKAYATRRTDVLIDLYERPRWANAIGDLFVSIHHNAMGSRNTAANGTETYYYPHSNDAALGFNGMTLATLLQNNLLAALGSTDRGVKSARFVVIRNTTIPSALVEIGFVTNPAEASRLASESYRQKAAEAIYNSVVEAFARYTPKR
jgi:N-acetylmuramoyl-L-alanine amidase